MSVTVEASKTSELAVPSARGVKKKERELPYRKRGSFNLEKPTLGVLVLKYVALIGVLLLCVGPFVWQLSTSFKGKTEDLYTFPPTLIPQHPTLDAYGEVMRTIPVFNYAWHSLLVGVATVVSNCVFALLAGYVISCMSFKGKALVLGLILSTMLLPGEVTLTSQYLTIKSLGFSNSLIGVFLPGAIGALNVLLMATACRTIPKEILDAAVIDGTNTWQRLWHIVWPNVKGMVSVVALMSFIGAWDDFLWPLVVLSDPAKYTLTVGMQYLASNQTLGTDPRVVAAGTVIALLPIIALFAFTQRFFFAGVETGAVKG
ncbi:MAG: carbohydrate ABC transporter permease [Actinomycetaceae bacterium]|nr:carbohydrate ABC transporter permease [Actinomycetaceae bacterium]